VNRRLDFPDLLELIDERSTAFRAVIAAAPELDVPVPTCPEWTLLDLAHHIGQGRRAWAATVAAGPDAPGKSNPGGAVPGPEDRRLLLDWLTDSTRQMLDALRAAGPDRGCWTWWGRSQTPQTCGAVARHQLHEVAVHAYDAQVAAGDPQPMSEDVALDGVEEFLFTVGTTTVAWPHQPAVVDYHAAEGVSWRNWLSGDGARAARLDDPATAGPADATARGSAHDIVLTLYGRLPLDSLELHGNREVFDQLVEWDPNE
jgi:uncharacterized protein (TIGR03083 family)